MAPTVPDEIFRLLRLIVKLKRHDTPHYRFYDQMLQKMCLSYGVKPFGPFPFMSSIE